MNGVNSTRSTGWLCEDIVANRALPPQELADSVFQTVRAFARGELRDDSTIFVLRLEG
jgi:serine phosphatase RsbU (regulator of sigma subunit)